MKSATTSSFTEIPCADGSKTYPGLFFINTTSGCKLFMSYFGDTITSYGIKNFSGDDVVIYYSSGSNSYYGGLCLSIIPAESTSNFGDPTTTTFIPSDATRICGTFYNRSGTGWSAALNPTSGMIYRYWLGATPETVFVAAGHDTSASGPGLAVPIYCTGKIFGELAHKEDNAITAKYGVLFFRKETSSYGESWTGILTQSITKAFGSGSFNAFGNFNMSNSSDIFTAGSFTRANGTWFLGGESVGYAQWKTAFAVTDNFRLIDPSVHYTAANTIRWCPIALGILSMSSEMLRQGGVVPDDGLKGYLDTDLFRASNEMTRGQMFDNGKFICLEDSIGLIIGWDSSNEQI
jgi:hypothetical protein